jgi:hypothetical protein
MSKLNKIITNRPVVLTDEEVNNLSETLSAVRTAGGGEGGHLYTGDNKYIGVDNSNYKIKFLDNAAEKLESISSKLDKTEAANTYLTSANAQTLYQTKEAMSAYAKKTELPDSITDFADTSAVIYSYIYETTSALEQQINAKQTKLQFDLNDKGEISAIGLLYGTTTALAGANGITGDYYSASNPSGFITSSVSVLDNFYSKTDTSSKTEIANAFDNIPKYILNGDSNITATSAQDGNNVRWDLAVNATPVVTDTTLTGDKGIYTHTTTKSGEWCVELVQSAYAAINDVQNKLDTTVADQTYQPKGDYVSSTDITDMATKTLVQNTSAAITALIPSTEGLAKETDLQIVSAGVDYVSAHAITAHQSLTNYYTKSETSGATELSTEFGKYALKSEIPTVPTKVSDLTDSANYYKTTDTSSKNELSTEFAKYLTNTQYNTDSATFVTKPTSLVDKYLVLRTDNAGNVSGWCDFQDQSYSKSEADRTFVATAYIDSTTLSGNGKSVSTKLGVKTDVIATIDYVSGNYLPTSGGTVTGQLEVHGGSNFDTQFIKLTREGNSCGARIGLGSDTTNGTLALKTFNGQGQNTVQVNIKHNTNNNELIQVQKGGSDVGFLIPAQIHQGSYTPTSADGILHIVLES